MIVLCVCIFYLCCHSVFILCTFTFVFCAFLCSVYSIKARLNFPACVLVIGSYTSSPYILPDKGYVFFYVVQGVMWVWSWESNVTCCSRSFLSLASARPLWVGWSHALTRPQGDIGICVRSLPHLGVSRFQVQQIYLLIV